MFTNICQHLMFVALLLPLLSCHEPLSCDRSSVAASAVTEPARAKPPTKRTVFTWRPETCRDFSVKKWDWSINHDLELLAQKTLQKRLFFVFWWKSGTGASAIGPWSGIIGRKKYKKHVRNGFIKSMNNWCLDVFSHGTSGWSTKIGLQLQFSYT